MFNGVENGRWWSSRSKRVPKHLWLKRRLADDSFTSDLVGSAASVKQRGKMPAEVWFESLKEDQYELQENSVRFADGIYTLLHLTDEELLQERMSAKRSSRNDHE